MSNSNSVQKVLRVALKRIQTRWGKGAWSIKTTADDGSPKYLVCIEGAVYGFCSEAKTQAQRDAMELVVEAKNQLFPNWRFTNIPHFNDTFTTTQEDAEAVVKLALIKSETGALDKDTEDNIAAEVDEMFDEGVI